MVVVDSSPEVVNPMSVGAIRYIGALYCGNGVAQRDEILVASKPSIAANRHDGLAVLGAFSIVQSVTQSFPELYASRLACARSRLSSTIEQHLTD
jgi:hypothetical protein